MVDACCSRQYIVDHGDIEAQPAGVLRLELPRLQLDHDVAQLLSVKEEQVNVEVVTVDIEMDLPDNETEAGAEFSQRLDDIVRQRLLEIPLSRVFAQVEEVEHERVLRKLPGQVRFRRGELRSKLFGAAPVRASVLFAMWLVSAFLDQPFSTAAVAYAFRAVWSSSSSRVLVMWPHGGCPTGCWINWFALGHSRANDLMYARFDLPICGDGVDSAAGSEVAARARSLPNSINARINRALQTPQNPHNCPQ